MSGSIRLFFAIVALAAALAAPGVAQWLSSTGVATLDGDPNLAPLPAKLSREDAIDSVRDPTHENVGRVDRLAAKLLTYEEYLEVAGPIHPKGGGTAGFMGDPSARVLWVVAVSGEIYPNGRMPVFFGRPPAPPTPTPYPPEASALFIVDATFGGGMITMSDERAIWPAVFDRLPNHPRAALVASSASPSPLGPRP